MKKVYLSLISALLLCAIAISFFGCNSMEATDLMEGITPNETPQKPSPKPPTASGDPTDKPPVSDEPTTLKAADNAAATDFALRLFRASNEKGKNTLISPLSVLCALSMTANGAKGETREQMEATLGMPIEELNLYISNYMNSLPNTEKYKLHLANSIWFTDDERFTVNEDFLQINADYYGAGAYKAPFDDSTLEDINNWVKKETDGMIPKVLDEIPPEAVMYLVNALAFEAEWAEIYNEYAVSDGTFTKEDGTKQSVEFMYSDESTYLEDDKAIGFKKYYKDRKYAFVALLPNEGVSVDEYIASLDGESLNALLSNAKNTSVSAKMPKFETEYDVEMSKVLQSMGMINAFDGNKADFSGLGTSSAGNLRINRVIHKTFISVAEKGTKAGASTVVEVTDESAPMEIKSVFLDRPFVYMLVDCENNLPFFIGTMMDIEK